MDRHRFLVSYGVAVALLSIFAFVVTGAPTSLIGAVMGAIIAIAARPGVQSRRGLAVAGFLTVLLLVQSLTGLVRGWAAPPPPDFGRVFFAILAAMSLTAILVLLSGRRSSRE